MKKIQALVIITLMLFTSVAVAGVNYKQFKVDAIDRGIQVLVDGNSKDLSTTPLIINGKVMVSLRDAAEIINKQIVWDATNNKVIMGNNIIPKTTATTENYKYIEEMTVIRNVGPFYQPKRPIAAAGKVFSHGVVVDLDSSKEALKVGDKIVADVKLLLNGNYSSMDGYIAVEDWSMNGKTGFIMRVFADDVEIYNSELIEPAQLANFLDRRKFGSLSNVKILKIEIEQQGMAVPGETSITKAALANFKFYKKN